MSNPVSLKRRTRRSPVNAGWRSNRVTAPSHRLGALIVAACLCVALTGSVTPAGAREAGEYDVKAAFLYNFALYVEWPEKTLADDAGGFVIGVLGDDPFGPVLDALARDKTVGGRVVTIQRFRTLDEYTPCHILFVSRGAAAELHEVLKKADASHVLVVGDVGGFARDGGMVNFVIEEGKVRFEINPDAVGEAGLSVSSKLLRLASIVRDGGA